MKKKIQLSDPNEASTLLSTLYELGWKMIRDTTNMLGLG